jgi:hypothetical protein
MNRDVRKDVQEKENKSWITSFSTAFTHSLCRSVTMTLCRHAHRHRSSKSQRILCVCSSFVSCSACVFDSCKRNVYPLVLRAPSDFTVRGTYNERIPSEKRTFALTLLFL